MHWNGNGKVQNYTDKQNSNELKENNRLFNFNCVETSIDWLIVFYFLAYIIVYQLDSRLASNSIHHFNASLIFGSIKLNKMLSLCRYLLILCALHSCFFSDNLASSAAKILVMSPSLTKSIMLSTGRIADALVLAGHNVVSCEPLKA